MINPTEIHMKKTNTCKEGAQTNRKNREDSGAYRK